MDKKIEPKYIFPLKEQKRILEHFNRYMNTRILPDKNIEAIILTGSLLKGKMGKYKKFHKLPGFKRLYSDIDLVLHVNDKFKPKKHWKPMGRNRYVRFYRITVFERKFPVICWVIKTKHLGKLAFSCKSDRKQKVIYKKLVCTSF